MFVLFNIKEGVSSVSECRSPYSALLLIIAYSCYIITSGNVLRGITHFRLT